MEPITPPTDIFTLTETSPDVKRETMLNLSYPDLIQLCKTNKSFSNICRDPYFWKAKLQKDYPSHPLELVRSNNYRTSYDRLYTSALWDKIHNKLKYLNRQLKEKEDRLKYFMYKKNLASLSGHLGKILNKEALQSQKSMLKERIEEYEEVDPEIQFESEQELQQQVDALKKEKLELMTRRRKVGNYFSR